MRPNTKKMSPDGRIASWTAPPMTVRPPAPSASSGARLLFPFRCRFTFSGRLLTRCHSPSREANPHTGKVSDDPLCATYLAALDVTGQALERHDHPRMPPGAPCASATIAASGCRPSTRPHAGPATDGSSRSSRAGPPSPSCARSTLHARRCGVAQVYELTAAGRVLRVTDVVPRGHVHRRLVRVRVDRHEQRRPGQRG